MSQNPTKNSSNRSVISVHTEPETSKRLDILASLTRRSKSFLANEAIERYLAEEEDFISSVKRGLLEADTGKLKTSTEAKDRVVEYLRKKTEK